MSQHEEILAGLTNIATNLAALDRRADTVSQRIDHMSNRLDQMERGIKEVRDNSQALRQDITTALDGRPWITKRHIPWHAA
jgi:peptidoglycan hydrolase CwlO-like protein